MVEHLDAEIEGGAGGGGDKEGGEADRSTYRGKVEHKLQTE